MALVEARIFMHEMRVSEAVAPGRAANMLLTPLARVIAVAVQDAEAPLVLGVPLGVPLPIIVMPSPTGMVIPEVHVHEPAGMLITSPSTAVCVGPLMTAFTLF
jgi:hypothetical protein